MCINIKDMDIYRYVCVYACARESARERERVRGASCCVARLAPRTMRSRVALAAAEGEEAGVGSVFELRRGANQGIVLATGMGPASGHAVFRG
jgi:hypothetical protein